MERWQVKIIALVGCFIIPFICTVLPLKLYSYFVKKGEKGKRILSYLMCYGGGVFFATFMLHMAPEAREIMEYSLMEPNGIHYPLPDLFMALGFFLVLVCEKIILAANAKRNKSKDKAEKDNCFIQKENINTTNSNGNSNGNTYSDNSKKMSKPQVMDIESLADPDCPLYGSGSCCKDPGEVTMQVNATEETGFLGSGTFSLIKFNEIWFVKQCYISRPRLRTAICRNEALII